MKIKFLFSILVSITVLLVSFVPVVALQDGTYPEAIVATVDASGAGGRAQILDSMSVVISICNSGPRCPISAQEFLYFNVFPSDSGNLLIANTANSSDFADFVARITDGVNGYVFYRVNGGGFIAPESSFFGSQVGPNGVDLEGSNINLIGLSVETAIVDSPGSDPNGDGVWTDYSLVGSLVFFEPITNKDACKSNGWQDLFTYDGSTFKNQGDCIQYFLTGF